MVAASSAADQKRECGEAGKLTQANTKDMTFEISQYWYSQKNGIRQNVHAAKPKGVAKIRKLPKNLGLLFLNLG